MQKKHKVLIGAGGTVLAIGMAVVAIASSGGPPPVDAGGNTASSFRGNLPSLSNDPLEPVGNAEADRRATSNAQDAKAAAERGETYVAPPVIADTMSTKDLMAQMEPPAPAPLPRVSDPSAIQRPMAAVATPPIDPYEQQAKAQRLQQESAARERVRVKVEQQIEALLTRKENDPISLVQFEKPDQGERSGEGQGASQPRQQSSQSIILAAKSGDVFYASLHTGFNSDDPRGLPVFATIYDYRQDNTVGPLHGARLAGQVTYADANASIVFKQIVLPDGRVGATEAMAVTTKDLRPGVAAKVDRHLFQRYSALVVSGLIQGAGEVGQMLVQNNQQTVIQDGIAVAGGQPIDWGAAALGATRPLGNALSAAARENFARKPTVSSVAGSDIGIVFLQPVTMPVAEVARR